MYMCGVGVGGVAAALFLDSLVQPTFDKEATGSFLSFCKNLRKYLMFPRKVLSCPVDVECGLGVCKWPAVMREVASCDRLQGCLLFFHFQKFGHFIYLSISPCTSCLQSQMKVYLIFQFVLATSVATDCHALPKECP